MNSRRAQLAGITANTPDPAGGSIQRDASGQPTGILLEDSGHAYGVVEDAASHAGSGRALDGEAQTLAWGPV